MTYTIFIIKDINDGQYNDVNKWLQDLFLYLAVIVLSTLLKLQNLYFNQIVGILYLVVLISSFNVVRSFDLKCQIISSTIIINDTLKILLQIIKFYKPSSTERFEDKAAQKIYEHQDRFKRVIMMVSLSYIYFRILLDQADHL